MGYYLEANIFIRKSNFGMTLFFGGFCSSVEVWYSLSLMHVLYKLSLQWSFCQKIIGFDIYNQTHKSGGLCLCTPFYYALGGGWGLEGKVGKGVSGPIIPSDLGGIELMFGQYIAHYLRSKAHKIYYRKCIET